VVVPQISPEEQAAAFVRANVDRVAVTRFALHHARLAAGDPGAVELASLCKSAGISVPKYPMPAETIPAGATLALTTIEQMIKQLGPRGATAVARTVADAYGDIPGAITAATLRGLAQVYAATAFEHRKDVMASVTEFLRRTPPEKLLSKARHRRELYGGAEWANTAAVIKHGVSCGTAIGRMAGEGGMRSPTREQLMGRR
jgi:hypothetical protein